VWVCVWVCGVCVWVCVWVCVCVSVCVSACVWVCGVCECVVCVSVWFVWVCVWVCGLCVWVCVCEWVCVFVSVWVCVCVCSLSYPACNEHAPYCHLWVVRLFSIFPNYLIYVKISEKKVLKTKCVFWVSLKMFSGTFLILKRTEGDIIKNVYWSSCTVPVLLLRFLWNLESPDKFSEGIQISNLIEILPVGAELFRADGRTDMFKANSRFPQFCERA
jgi:hypothetical protein